MAARLALLVVLLGGCASAPRGARSALAQGGSTVGGAALRSSTEFAEPSEVERGESTRLVPRDQAFTPGEAALVTGGAAMVALSQRGAKPPTPAAAKPPPVADPPTSPPAAYAAPDPSRAPAGASSTEANVADPAVIEAACRSALEGN